MAASSKRARAKTTPPTPKAHKNSAWSIAVISILSVLGLVAFTGFTSVHWVERQILTPETWAQTVGTLPKNSAVSSALSSYVIDQLVTSTNLETTIQESLPERAAFLAGPLTDQLERFLTTQTTRVIQSDQFQAVWMSTNQAVINQLVTGAREPNSQESSVPAQIRIPLAAVKNVVTTILQNQGVISSNPDQAEDLPLVVNLKASVNTIHQQIRLVDFLNATLWLIAVVALLGAVVLAKNRRKLILILALSITVLALLQLIGIRALRPAILNFFADASALTAAGVVYDTLVASFKDMAVWILSLSAVAALITILTSPRITRKSKTITRWVATYETSRVKSSIETARLAIGKGRWYIIGIAGLVGLTLAAFVIPVNLQNGVLIVLYVVLLAEVTALIAKK